MKNSSANELIKKEVEFQGSKILGIMENGKIYVGVKAVCNGMGMSKNLLDTQVKKVQSDELLRTASKLTQLETRTGLKETLVLELDYLPAWLFKINPSRFNDDLKQKLLAYQLKAKDILAEAFLGRRETLKPIKSNNNEWGVATIKTNLSKAEIIENEIDRLLAELKPLYAEIEKIAYQKGENFVGTHCLFHNVDKEKTFCK
ncbi:MAG: phage antirepressor N-terminal domain-containing protein [Cetobacterium sp.]|uniref:phage antirepressor N-terminal domain-containing protein n=1 Tax=Cetobacterium sp. TaxID=2071632 RepID=UPI003EE4DE80